MDPQPAVVVSFLGSAHLDDVAGISDASFATPWPRDAFAEELASPGRWGLVARRPGRRGIDAYALCWRVQDEVHVLSLATHPKARRHGVASRLLDVLVERARAEGARHVTLEVRDKNQAALALYKQAGFEPVGVIPRYYEDQGSDAVVLVRRL